MILRKLFKKVVKRTLKGIAISYSQFGEDLIIAYLLHQLQISKPTYLDVGANEPRIFSNTNYFYENGSRGVLVEPNPYLYQKLLKQRKGDVVLNMGIAFNEDTEADYYMFPNYANGLNTFSKQEAEHWRKVGMKGLGTIPVEKVIKMPLQSINAVFEKYFPNKPVDILSVDVEGLDLQIMNTLHFEKYRPKIICIETLSYDENQNGYKNQTIIDFLVTKDYSLYADTRVNSIFCRNDLLPR